MRRKLWIALAASTVLVAVPLTFSSGGRPELNDACGAGGQTGTCCRTTSAWCNAGGDDHFPFYYKESGDC